MPRTIERAHCLRATPYFASHDCIIAARSVSPMNPNELAARYARHLREAERTSFGLHVWHVAAARGLYRMLADVELAGGPPAPMGMPHVLCVSDVELQYAR